MSNLYNVYIDESGDEGINKGSNYFIITAIVVNADKDLEVSKSVDRIKSNLEMDIKKQLHWKLLKGYPNKLMIMQEVSNLDLRIINIIIDTRQIKFLPQKNIYFHFSGYLYERISWYMKEVNGKATVNISSRGNLSKNKLQNYLQTKNHKDFDFDVKNFAKFKIIPNERKKLLQLADCCCSALFQALKYQDKCYNYVYTKKDKIYCKNNNITSYGLKLVPSGATSKEYKALIKYLEQ